ncbi:MAG TPA: alkaline phosphatase family protein, partial [Polyangiaceae bacterium]|nr:alkaline phosphatase family protein [Polyangiaceae bacterium]
MSIRKVLALGSMSLMAACGSNGGGSSAAGERTAALGQPEEVSRGDGEEGDRSDEGDRVEIRHVLLISVDGLHETDVAHFVAAHPESTLAELGERGVQYTDAHTPTPSDSFPGLAALVTGGTPKTTGLYYDDSYDRTLFPPGSNCLGSPGTECTYFEIANVDFTKLFSPINPAALPQALDGEGHCNPVLPHEFIKVNTIFEVIRAAGMHTAWSDKHPAYDWTNGPSGKGVEDLYTPEINSPIKNGGTANGVDLTATLALCDGKTNSLKPSQIGDYTTCEPAVMAYDDVKVQAVLNEIHGMTSDGSKAAPFPNILGMNFQEVSVGEKLPVGGYKDGAGNPTALLEGAIAHVDHSLGRMVAALKTEHALHSTLIVISAKHGQSPIDPKKLAMEKGGHGNATVTDPIGFINAADPNVDNVFATFVNPNDGSSPATDGHFQTDDVGILWLQNQAPANISAVVAQLTDPAHRAAIFADTLPPGTIFSSNINFGTELAAIYGDPTSSDPLAAARAPNAVVQPNWGVIYNGGSKKIAEHGGGTLDDTHVALLVSNPGLHRKTVRRHVSTTQVAPTILRALDLEPSDLDAVRKEGTKPL